MDRVQVKRFYTDEVGVRFFGWQEIVVAEALKLAEPRLRCPECEGAVRLHQASSDGKMAAHAEHWKINRGCSWEMNMRVYRRWLIDDSLDFSLRK